MVTVGSSSPAGFQRVLADSLPFMPSKRAVESSATVRRVAKAAMGAHGLRAGRLGAVAGLMYLSVQYMGHPVG